MADKNRTYDSPEELVSSQTDECAEQDNDAAGSSSETADSEIKIGTVSEIELLQTSSDTSVAVISGSCSVSDSSALVIQESDIQLSSTTDDLEQFARPKLDTGSNKDVHSTSNGNSTNEPLRRTSGSYSRRSSCEVTNSNRSDTEEPMELGSSDEEELCCSCSDSASVSISNIDGSDIFPVTSGIDYQPVSVITGSESTTTTTTISAEQENKDISSSPNVTFELINILESCRSEIESAESKEICDVDSTQEQILPVTDNFKEDNEEFRLSSEVDLVSASSTIEMSSHLQDSEESCGSPQPSETCAIKIDENSEVKDDNSINQFVSQSLLDLFEKPAYSNSAPQSMDDGVEICEPSSKKIKFESSEDNLPSSSSELNSAAELISPESSKSDPSCTKPLITENIEADYSTDSNDKKNLVSSHFDESEVDKPVEESTPFFMITSSPDSQQLNSVKVSSHNSEDTESVDVSQGPGNVFNEFCESSLEASCGIREDFDANIPETSKAVVCTSPDSFEEIEVVKGISEDLPGEAKKFDCDYKLSDCTTSDALSRFSNTNTKASTLHLSTLLEDKSCNETDSLNNITSCLSEEISLPSALIADDNAISIDETAGAISKASEICISDDEKLAYSDSKVSYPCASSALCDLKSTDVSCNNSSSEESNCITSDLSNAFSKEKDGYSSNEAYPVFNPACLEEEEPMDIDSPESVTVDANEYSLKAVSHFNKEQEKLEEFQINSSVSKVSSKKKSLEKRNNRSQPRNESGRFLKMSQVPPDISLLDEETRMEGTPSSIFLDEDSQSSAGTPSIKKEVRRFRCEVIVPESTEVFTAEKVVEYIWPLDGSGDHYFIQEQISKYLGIMSFKRKYPDLRRRPIDKLEKEYLREQGYVSEIACDLGLTALRSEDVLDVMFNDFPNKYEELQKVLREKKERQLKERGRVEYLVADLDKSKIQEYARKAAENTAKWNALFNRERREERRYCLDLQTSTLQKPIRPSQKVPPEYSKMGYYPIALIPGQYTDHYKAFSSAGLKSLPLNTIVGSPPSQDPLGSDGNGTESDEDILETESIQEVFLEEEDEYEKACKGLKCKVCSGGFNANKQNRPEPLVTCASCNNSNHLSCVDLTSAMYSKISSYKWQCMECKTCYQCSNTDDEDKMIFCDLCDRGYHIYCVGLRKVPQGRWHCRECAICSSCGARTPAGSENLKNAEWQHEFRKDKDNKTMHYATTLCAPCDKYWKRRQFCYICLKVYRSIPEDGMVRCINCPKYVHREDCSTEFQSERYCNNCFKKQSSTALNHSRIIAAAKKKMAAGY